MDNTLIKRALAVLGLAAFMAVLVLIPIVLYADTLYRASFGPQAVYEPEENCSVTAFDLSAQEGQHQTKSRISGWLSTVSSQEVTVSSPRGKLGAMQYEPISDEKGAVWALVLHGGLGTDRSQVMDIACALSICGYRVLTPDLYAHGKSEGDASTLGFGDAQDVRAWIDYVKSVQPDARIVIYGQDEGAAAVLLAACDGFDDCVAAVAVDSVFDDGTAHMLKLAGVKENSFSAMLLRIVFHRKAGENGRISISDRISSVKTPLLLIHGTGDQLTPAWHSEDIALAAGECAQLLYIEGAGHGLSRFVQPQTVYDALFAFYEEALES